MDINMIREQYNELLKNKAYEVYNGTCYAVASYYEQSHPFLRGWRRSNVSCPMHEDRSPSLHIYRDTFKCFTAGCNMQGDAYALIRHLEKCTFNEAQDKFANILNMPTFYEFSKGKPKMYAGAKRNIKPFPVTNEVLWLIRLSDDTAATVSDRMLTWIDHTGEDEEHDLKNSAFWYGKNGNDNVYMLGRTETLSIKSLWADGNVMLVHRLIKGKILETFDELKKEYHSNIWNDKSSVFYKKYELHDILESWMDKLIQTGSEVYGMELSYKKLPTYI